jgi:hypothetical protein
MAYIANFILATFGGYFSATAQEQWQASVKIHAPSGSDYSLTKRTDFLTGIASSVQAFHSNATLKAGGEALLKRLTCAHIGTDGKYVGGGLQVTAEYIYATAIAGSGVTDRPWSQALALTFRSDIARGRASHGRMYWPATALAVQAATGMLTSATQTTLATAAKTLLDAINAQANVVWGEGAHMVCTSNVGTGLVAYVTKVGIGGKMDRQERREKELEESHVYSTLVAPPTTPLPPGVMPGDGSPQW